MVFKKVPYYMYDVRILIRCEHVPLRICLITLNLKVNNWKKEEAGMLYVSFKHVKGIAQTLADRIS